jgi:hypothetical protein
MEYILPLVEFPAQIAVSHMVASRWFPFYSHFTDVQKYEWLAWTSTVMFQTTFTVAYLFFNMQPLTVGMYFLGHVVYDTAFLTFYNRDKLMYVHHVVSIIMCISMYFVQSALIAQVAKASALLECSNILLGTTWLLNRAGYGKTLAVQILGGLALVTYLALRLYFFPKYLMFDASWFVASMMFIFVPMNVVWSWKLVGYYYHIAFAKKSGGERLE